MAAQRRTGTILQLVLAPGDKLAGRALTAGHRPRLFWGWTGLLAVLEEARGQASEPHPAPPAGASPPPPDGASPP